MQDFLSEVSKNIFDISGGADLITNFHIELPPAWRNTECTADIKVYEGQLAPEVDVEISGTHPVTGDSPHADQFGGCGVRGQKVVIPHHVLTEEVKISSDNLRQSLLEVMRWRYGVFAEAGVDNDDMYPLNTTAGPVTVTNVGCEDSEQDRVGLCPLTDYNSWAHTKQNLLCGGLSARRSILNQFSAKDGAKFVKPVIKFVMPLDTKRVILILDQSPAMAPNWKSVLASTFQFINSLREGTELVIVSFNHEATVHLQPTRVEGGNREGLHYRIPRRLPRQEDATGEKMKSCLDCAIELAESLATNTTSMLLLSSYVYFDSKNNSKLMEFEQGANPIIHWLVFGSGQSSRQQQQHIHNRVFLINEHQNTLNTTSNTNLALASTLTDYPSQKFHHEMLPLADVEGSFSVEASLSSDLWLQLIVEDTTAVNVFEIKSPSGQIFSFPKFDAGLVYFSLRGPRETGVWSYRIQFYSQETRMNKNVILECWATGHSAHVHIGAWSHVPSDINTQPVIIYTKLDQDQVPVSGVSVMAVVTNSRTRDMVTVPLVDTGSGYPDITRGDGVYSGYFTQYVGEPAMYSVQIIADNNSTATVLNTKKLENVTISAGSSALPTQPSVPLESFRRFTSAASFYISQGSEFYISSSSVHRRDTFSPNRITDFKLTNYFNNSLFVTLSWTSPGDDLTLGTAFRYEIRCFTAQEALSEQNFGEQGILIHSSLVPSPEPAGTEQRCTVGVPWPNEVFYYSIVAFDAAGNRGEVSNSIAVYVEEPITTTNEPSTIKFSNMKDVSSTLPLKSFIESESLMYIIAGIISLILIIIVIILTVIIRRLGGCTNKNDPSTLSSAPETMSSPSLPDLCHEQYMRNSISYISGYDLPEMLEYALDSPQKPGGQEMSSLGRPRQLQSTDQSQYLGMNTSSVYQSPSIRSPMSPCHVDISNYSCSAVGAKNTRTIATTTASTASSTTHKYNTVAGVTKIYNTPEVVDPESPGLGSPSVSPVNSNYTGGGQSTDCSVSVSGSDHELIGDNLQVVMLPPHSNDENIAALTSINRDNRGILHQSNYKPEPKPRKIPPAVPNKTVHASLV